MGVTCVFRGENDDDVKACKVNNEWEAYTGQCNETHGLRTFRITGWAFLEHHVLSMNVDLKAFLLGLPVGQQSWHFHDYGDLRLKDSTGGAKFGDIYHTESVDISKIDTTPDMC